MNMSNVNSPAMISLQVGYTWMMKQFLAKTD